ncbi:MAG TPA: hypothetical protein VLM37_07245 [Fibrobacteraceae bacterium]|nr:hypothetical protein [Fibrobacteraceae bacterium]
MGCACSYDSTALPFPTTAIRNQNSHGIQFTHQSSQLFWSGLPSGPYRVTELDAAGREVFRSGVLATDGAASLRVSLPNGHGPCYVRLEDLATGKTAWSGW